MLPSENPWPAVILCLIGIVASVILWMSRQQRWPIAMGVIFFALAVGAIAWDRMVLTPREQIIENVLGITRAFQQRELEKTYSYISKSAWDVQLLAAEGYNRITVSDDMRVSDIQVEMLAQGERALATFRVNATISAGPLGTMRRPTMWETKWQLEPEGWKMIDITALNPITQEREPYLEDSRERLRMLYSR